MAEFLTGDDAMGSSGKLHEKDREVMHAAETGEGLVKIKPGELQELAQRAASTFDFYDTEILATMTSEQADYVRKIRIDEGYSWRAVAAEMYDALGRIWSPPSNQLAGMALCKVAAAVYFEGQDFMDPPWNG